MTLTSTASPLWVMDGSHWKGNVNMPALEQEGYNAVIWKATQGTSYVDETWQDFQTKMAAEKQLVCGGFHFLETGNIPAQVGHFLAAYPHTSHTGRLVGVDIERDGASGPCPTPAEAIQFLSLLERECDCPKLIYLPFWVWQQVWGSPHIDLSKFGVLWASRYPSRQAGYASTLYQNSLTWLMQNAWTVSYAGFHAPTLVQFTSNATAMGLPKGVDVSAFAGTDLQSLLGRNTPVVPPTPIKRLTDSEKIQIIFHDVHEGNADGHFDELYTRVQHGKGKDGKVHFNGLDQIIAAVHDNGEKLDALTALVQQLVDAAAK